MRAGGGGRATWRERRERARARDPLDPVGLAPSRGQRLASRGQPPHSAAMQPATRRNARTRRGVARGSRCCASRRRKMRAGVAAATRRGAFLSPPTRETHRAHQRCRRRQSKQGVRGGRRLEVRPARRGVAGARARESREALAQRANLPHARALRLRTRSNENNHRHNQRAGHCGARLSLSLSNSHAMSLHRGGVTTGGRPGAPPGARRPPRLTARRSADRRRRPPTTRPGRDSVSRRETSARCNLIESRGAAE